MANFKALAAQYKAELLDKVIPFWLEHSQDKEYLRLHPLLSRLHLRSSQCHRLQNQLQ